MFRLKFIVLLILIFLLFMLTGGEHGIASNSVPGKKMEWIKGGSFLMGDLFKEGRPDEKPVHRVNLAGFFMGKYEVQVKEFRKFAEETGYKTRAEMNVNKKALDECIKQMRDKKNPPRERMKFYLKMLTLGGTHCYNPVQKSWEMKSDANWQKPYFIQSENDPVTCVCWIDAVGYCNWLSKRENLSPAYNIKTGELLDTGGRSTADITKVRGYRLPTEAEWEFAARERGKKFRFGNGKNLANSQEINFDASSGNYPYLNKGKFRKKTTPAGNFSPNGAGLYDMSGNVWEWCSDYYAEYSDQEKVNPYINRGLRRVVRGGRWGGSAYEMRVACRFGWTSSDRCNNIGFRIARSK